MVIAFSRVGNKDKEKQLLTVKQQLLSQICYICDL